MDVLIISHSTFVWSPWSSNPHEHLPKWHAWPKRTIFKECTSALLCFAGDLHRLRGCTFCLGFTIYIFELWSERKRIMRIKVPIYRWSSSSKPMLANGHDTLSLWKIPQGRCFIHIQRNLGHWMKTLVHWCFL